MVPGERLMNDLWRYAAVVAGFGACAACILWGIVATLHDMGIIDLNDRK
jgi:hypothetical protein